MSIASGETELLRKAQSGDAKCRERVIVENMGLVRSIAKRFSGRGCDMEDVVQLGTVGLFKAMEKFDFSYGVRFSTYAVPLITGEIKRFLRDNGAIRVSRATRELSFKIEEEARKFESENGRSPAVSELAGILKVSEDDIIFAVSSREAVASLDEIMSDSDGLSRMEKIPDNKAESEEEITDKILIEKLMETLPEREKIIIRARYFEGITQTETAKLLGISQVQISRLEKRALASLREKCINLY